jgi:glutamate-5-semialdehyde dehydrogenase
MTSVQDLGIRARAAARKLALTSTAQRNEALAAIADELLRRREHVLARNAEDVGEARQRGLSDALVDRLLLDEARIERLAQDTRAVAELPDPTGRDLETRTLPNGIRLVRRSVPLGVLGVIYEARPNVTVDIAALALKTGNAAILRGGKETRRSNAALADVLSRALAAVGFPKGSLQLITDPDRKHVRDLLKLDAYVDMIIPRGGAGLHRLCLEESTIPVITGGIGICHIFADESADLSRAVDIIENAKVQRPSVCNALDTLLVHERIAGELLPRVADRLAPQGVRLHAGPRALEHLAEHPAATAAAPDAFDQEWLGLDLSVEVVAGLDEALGHIAEHSTQHTDAILTDSDEHAERFVREVDSAAVFVNASTRFTDGGQFGLGAEVAVSTQKLHARGPMGLEALTTYKWVGYGSGQIRP